MAMATAMAITVVAAGAGPGLVPTCGAAVAAGGRAHVVRSTVSADGLRVDVTATESATSGVVRVAAKATAGHARGALGYVVTFGDGSSAHNVLPQFCLAGRGGRRQARWLWTHHYVPGTYHLAVRVHVNCTTATATARLTVRAA